MKTSQRGLAEMIILLIIGGVVLLGGLAYFGLDVRSQDDETATTTVESLWGDMTGDDNNDDDTTVTTSTTTTTDGTATSSVGSSSDVAFTLRLQNLSDEQRAFLRLKGIDGDEVQVTNGMVACAEGKLGADRVVAIRNGASLSMAEQVELLACYE